MFLKTDELIAKIVLKPGASFLNEIMKVFDWFHGVY